MGGAVVMGLAAGAALNERGGASKLTDEQITEIQFLLAEDAGGTIYVDQGAYRSFHATFRALSGSELAALHATLPHRYAAARASGDVDLASEMVDALHALDDVMRARGMTAPAGGRPSTSDILADWVASGQSSI
ncbi:hypothetical protein jaqu_28490 [Jannaschia aquimarina]|uniref:Uncharacterized protein n=2 Tax=Jannaschia aquimarina TaxID=935700 RepID=A0A0D1EHV6_9RHOB|nr:hypothetical protein jaqu_28490 [Jannaschia aquimarina]SNT22652.1 hypothetical protein SAMN05421775_10865 [Jannaschia aquimarina]